MSNRMRTGCCGGRRFSVAPAHHPRRPGAATHARKTRVSCSLSALRRVAGKPASNRVRSVCCDGSCVPHLGGTIDNFTDDLCAKLSTVTLHANSPSPELALEIAPPIHPERKRSHFCSSFHNLRRESPARKKKHRLSPCGFEPQAFRSGVAIQVNSGDQNSEGQLTTRYRRHEPH